MNEEGVLMIFVKNPVEGQVKTRLAEEIGDHKALWLYKTLINHTAKVTKDLPYPKKVFYSNFIDSSDEWTLPGFRKDLQSRGDLGEKMGAAFIENLKYYQKAVIIGSDCPGLGTHHLKTAFQKLDEYDFVIGPAMDGGYYLLGMKAYLPAIFSGKSWSTSNLLTETLETLKKHDKNYFLLEELNDIDTLGDLMESPLYKEIKQE